LVSISLEIDKKKLVKKMGEIFAELWISLKKTFDMNEKKTLEKWSSLISEYQKLGIDISIDKPSFLISKPPNEIWLGLSSGEKTQEPNYDAMYSLLGKFIQFLYEEMLFNGVLEVKLERTGGSG
jgi:hypothetical protein